MPSQATQAQQATEIHGAAALAAANRADCAGQMESAQSAAQRSARSMPITQRRQPTQAPAGQKPRILKKGITGRAGNLTMEFDNGETHTVAGSVRTTAGSVVVEDYVKQLVLSGKLDLFDKLREFKFSQGYGVTMVNSQYYKRWKRIQGQVDAGKTPTGNPKIGKGGPLTAEDT